MGWGGSYGWDRVDERVVAGTRGPRALLLAPPPWGWRGVWGRATLKSANWHHLSSHLDPVPTAWFTLCYGLGAIRVWSWALCALIPPASQQAKVGALVRFLAFELCPTMADGVPGAPHRKWFT